MESIPPPSVCPQCGAAKVVPVFYGMPRDMAMTRELLDRGLLELGGCDILVGLSCCWRCTACQHSWGLMGGPDEEACEAAIARLFQAERDRREQVRLERMYPTRLQPWIDYLLITAISTGAAFLVIEYVTKSKRLEDCPTLYLVQGGRRERLEDGGVARHIVDQSIPREATEPDQALRVRVQGQEVFLGLEQRTARGRTFLVLRLDALRGLEFTPVAAPVRPPSCRYCDSPLRTPRAPQCFHCGMSWRDPNHVVNTRSRR